MQSAVKYATYVDSWDDEIDKDIHFTEEDTTEKDTVDMTFETDEETRVLCGIEIPLNLYEKFRPERIERLERFRTANQVYELTQNQEFIFKTIIFNKRIDLFNASDTGSGKTTGLVWISYLCGLLATGERNTTVIVVSRAHKELIKEIYKMIEKVGGIRQSESDPDIDKSSVLVVRSGVTEGEDLTVETFSFYEFVIIELEQLHRLPSFFDKIGNFRLVLDEAHTLFNGAIESYHEYCEIKKSTDPEDTRKIEEIETSDNPFARKLMNWYEGNSGCGIKPKRDILSAFGDILGQCEDSRKLQQIFLLSGTGYIDQDTMRKPYHVARDFWRKFGLTLEFINFKDTNSLVRVHYFELHKEGIYTTEFGPEVYEEIMKFFFMSIGSGRTLMVCRDSQMELILENLRDFAIFSGFKYTSDPKHWFDHDVKIIVIRQSEIDKVAGLTLPGLETVVFTTGGRREYLSKIIQTAGRVGRKNNDDQQRVLVFTQCFGKPWLVKEETETGADFLEYCRDKRYQIILHNTKKPIDYDPFERDFAVLRRRPYIQVPEDEQRDFCSQLDELNRPIACPKIVRKETCTARACHTLHKITFVHDIRGDIGREPYVIPNTIRIHEPGKIELCRFYCDNGYCGRSECKKIHHEGYYTPKPKKEFKTWDTDKKVSSKVRPVSEQLSKKEYKTGTPVPSKPLQVISREVQRPQRHQRPETTKPKMLIRKVVQVSEDGFTQVGKVKVNKVDQYTIDFPELPNSKPPVKTVSKPVIKKTLVNSFGVLDDDDEL